MKETLLAYFRMPGTWAGFVALASGVVTLKFGDAAGQLVGLALTHLGTALIAAPV